MLMSDGLEASTDAQRADLAAAFGQRTDPLKEHTAKFKQIDIDPFELFFVDVLSKQGLAEDTVKSYHRHVDQWQDFMRNQQNRHPVCPNEQHVRSFMRYYRDEVGNQPNTVKTKLLHLNKAYEYWQQDPAFPHPQDFNPFTLVMSKESLPRTKSKEPHRITIEEIGEIIRGVTHIRDRAILLIQLKLGLRAGEVCNIQLQDIHLNNSEIRQFYSELGSHPSLEGRENALYVPSSAERDGNKSRRPRLLPLDDETRHVLLRYLLTRPDADHQWLFYSDKLHSHCDREYINEVWKDYFHPKYAETEQHRRVTSHFGRHRFTTYWQVEQDINRELVQYMRGDITRNGSLEDRSTIDEYIHTYYEDIEDVYRNLIFKFQL